MIRSALHYFDYKYYIKFALLFLAMYACYTVVIGITTPGGSYYPFFDQFLNFPALIRISVLNSSQLITQFFGCETFVDGDRLLSMDETKIIRMWWPCYGLMLKSFWLAYVIAHQNSFRTKLFWSLAGIFTIFFINCFRISFMMISMDRNWTLAESLNTNNHDFFNYLSYLFLIILIILYNKFNKKA